MNILNYINYITMAVPAALFAAGIWDNELFLWGLVAMIWTGLFQAVIGFKIFFDDPNRLAFKIYVLAVIIFFIVWGFTGWVFVWPVPPVLSIYFSMLLFLEAKKQSHEPQHP